MELKHIAWRDARLSAILREDMKISAGLMNRLKWKELLFVNGQPRHTDYPVKTGDLVCLELPEEAPVYPPEEGPLTILYEDQHLLAVEKPAGMLIHPSRSRLTGTLANYVLSYYQKTGQSCVFHPLTRLDRDTFGVVLLAKNPHIHALLMERPPEKTYEALVYGGPREDAGVIEEPIARRPLPSLLRMVDPAGKPCRTDFRVLEHRAHTTLLELQPITGRTHQLRVHCAYRGYPILGDPQYGSEASQEWSRERGLEGQLLCARSLGFFHPVSGTFLEIRSQMTLPDIDK